MTDVARRSALNQKQRLDEALLERRRREVLAELGETLHELVRSGELELDELPELLRGVEAVDEIDRQIEEAESGGRGPRRPVRLTRNDAPADWSREARGSQKRPPGRSTESIGRDNQPRVVGPPPVEPRVWRPGVGAPSAPPVASDPAPGGGGDGGGGGGIVFLDDDAAPSEPDPDDSLEEYMNDEDVPRRG